jgi:hypothetical protein
MTRPSTTRRNFLAAAGLAAAGVAAWPTPASAFVQATPRVRRNVKNLDPNGPEIAQLREAFQILEARPSTNVLSWLTQANIHRSSCAHANWWFFPWHRAYLWYFEQVLQAAVNDPTLSIPYWDWSDPSSRTIPAAFWTRYLYRVVRGVGPSDAVPDEYVDPVSMIEPILEITDFQSFSGVPSSAPTVRVGAGWLEGSPHNNVHNWVGGAMAVPAWAAQDPIFWLHHANVDRLWSEWMRRNPNGLPSDATWWYRVFGFYDTTGQVVGIMPSQVLATESLGYTYEPGGTGTSVTPAPAFAAAAAAAPEPAPRLHVEAAPAKPMLGPAPVTVTLPLAPEQHETVRAAAARAPGAPRRAGSVRLAVMGIQPPDNPGVIVRVFLNLPTASATTSFRDPHYVGNFSFFASDAQEGMGAGHGHGPYTQYLDVTDTLRRLQDAGAYKPGDPLTVTLLAVPVAGRKEETRTVPFQKVAVSVLP